VSGFAPGPVAGFAPRPKKLNGVLRRAVAAWKAENYQPNIDALVDLTGRGHHALFGSTVGPDTNDPLVLPFSGEKYLYLPGTAGNSLAVTNPGGTTYWTATFVGAADETGDSAAATLTFGGTDAAFAGKKLTSVTLYSDSGRTTQTGQFLASSSVEPHTGLTDADSNAWTINRSATDRRAVLGDRPLLLFGADDFLEVPHNAEFNLRRFEPFSAVIALRHYPTTNYEVFIGKRTWWEIATGAGWNIRNPNNAQATQWVASTADGSYTSAITRTLPTGYGTALGLIADGTGAFLGASGGSSSAMVVMNGTEEFANVLPLRIGARSGTPGDYAQMEFIGAAVFREALTPADLALVAAEFGVTP